MGRKIAFDRDEALAAALKAFWLDGYDKTSLEDLLSAMKIKNSSFYNTFESKEALFLEAVQSYRRGMGFHRLNLLRSTEVGGKEALLQYFDHLIFRDGARDGLPPGCFMMKTAATLLDPTSKVGHEVATSIANLEKGFGTALERGIQNRDFPPTLDVESMSRLLLSTAYGLSILARTKKSRNELLATAHYLINSLSLKRGV